MAGSPALFLLTFDNPPEKFNGFTDGSMVAYIKTQQGNEFIKTEGSVIALDNLALDKNLNGYVIPFNTFEPGSFILAISILKDLDFAQLKAGEEYTSKEFNVASIKQ